MPPLDFRPPMSMPHVKSPKHAAYVPGLKLPPPTLLMPGLDPSDPTYFDPSLFANWPRRGLLKAP